MKTEDKQLLIEDLCARLSYGVKISVNDKVETLQGINIPDNIVEYDSFLASDIEEVRPYLFPMSSMTEEQRLEVEILTNGTIGIDQDSIWDLTGYSELNISTTLEIIQWLYKNHFDYRGLIDKDLAIDATGKNIY